MLEFLSLFDGRFPFLHGPYSASQHIPIVSLALIPTLIRKMDVLAVGLYFGAFLTSLFQFRLVAPFVLLLLIHNDWKRIDANGWMLIMVFFAMQVGRFFMGGRWPIDETVSVVGC